MTSQHVKHLRVSHAGRPLLDLRGRNVTPKSIERAVRLFQDLVVYRVTLGETLTARYGTSTVALAVDEALPTMVRLNVDGEDGECGVYLPPAIVRRVIAALAGAADLAEANEKVLLLGTEPPETPGADQQDTT